MVRIEYDNTEVYIPENWGDIKLGFYESFYKDTPTTARERVALVAKICKIDEDALLGWPVEVFNRIVGYLGFLFQDSPAKPCNRVEIEGTPYTVPVEDELSLGAWVDADAVQKEGSNVLSNMLAIVCRPAGEAYDYRNNEARQRLFSELPVDQVLGLLAFFLHCKNALDRRTAAYSSIALAYSQLPRSMPLFRKGGVGIRSLPNWQTIRYLILIRLLRSRLRKCLPSYDTAKKRVMPKKRSVN